MQWLFYLIILILLPLPSVAAEPVVRVPAETPSQSPRPLLELGVGTGTGLLPDYPGSDQEHYHFAAFPVMFYHGQIFRSDREDGARARVVNKPIFGIDVSGSGAFPIESDQNRAREGMKSLGWMVEMGPRVFARLLDEKQQVWRVFAMARPAATIRAGRIYGRGLVSGIGAQFEHNDLFVPDLGFFSKVTAQWASREYGDYFYGVTPEYATATRTSYKAEAGYLGTWASAGLGYEFSDFIVSGGFSAISTKGSANEKSSLFRDDLNFSVFVGFVWFFYHSETPGYY